MREEKTFPLPAEGESPKHPAMTPSHLAKWTALQHEVRELRQTIRNHENTIAALTHELESSSRNAIRLDELSTRLHLLLGEYYDRFSRREQQFMQILLKKSPNIATHEEIMTYVYSGQIDGPPADKIKDVYICKLRRKLRKFNIQAAIITVWGAGWKLEHPADPNQSRVITGNGDIYNHGRRRTSVSLDSIEKPPSGE